MTRYVRTELSKRDRWTAIATSLAVAAGAGVATFVVTRLFLAREAIPDPEPADAVALEAPPSERRLGDGGP